MYTIEVKYKSFLKQVNHTLQDYHKSNAKLFLQSLHWWVFTNLILWLYKHGILWSLQIFYYL